MTISYTESVKLKTTEAVFARGIKYFLFKKVKSQTELLLPAWRDYNVKGENQMYVSRVPLVHLLKPITNNEDLASVLELHSSCTCQYFIDYGLCKHIVAVCCELDTEFFDPKKDFKLKNDAKELAKLQSSNILDNIFGIEKEKKFNEFITYLFKPNTPSYLSREMVIESEKEFREALVLIEASLSKKGFEETLTIFANEIKKTKLIESKTTNLYPLLFKINQEVNAKLGFYKEEKEIFTLLEKVVYFWQDQTFLYMILSWLQKITADNQTKIIYLLFKLSFTILAESKWAKTWNLYLGSSLISEEVLENVMGELLYDFGAEAQISSSFAIKTRYISWLEKNIENLPNPTLLEVIEILPEEHEKVDQILRDRAIAWVDYLPTNTAAYQDLSQFIHGWAQILGVSQYLEEVLEHIRRVHVKKKALLTLLSDLK